MNPVCHLDDLPEGESLRLPTEPPIAVFHTEGTLYAIDDTCSHQDASLSEGWLEGCFVECPLHAALFDLRTGQPSCLPARRPVRTHRVTVDASGGVHVQPTVGEGHAEEGTAA
ncbi:bifunctional 3-phenylpropionate/cinnamic acid dioxygenase ferredoxin subunit [Streptomyces sp. H27-C3]|uniref:bifunctional 3-phenylpropionate/cinnamic acid dioxygenase ferredoxin subunit n=1 Tax=Streptomyces sp. H27-C3 TaxID=3046305 RepID=UPI0024BA7108|nr:bifunctional 3-phenylpropionate/cinnamic acid dioxygenase ferredoxin subunit [Streptomyces sp. H27-C3]MDJ0462634.1 bifunctional 3-phenylpropionate/cinnamic acid dioxygenase ferredoxin subunit [Streptomyces sp. H27-C3]